jgi:hypothetical protein
VSARSLLHPRSEASALIPPLLMDLPRHGHAKPWLSDSGADRHYREHGLGWQGTGRQALATEACCRQEHRHGECRTAPVELPVTFAELQSEPKGTSTAIMVRGTGTQTLWGDKQMTGLAVGHAKHSVARTAHAGLADPGVAV